MIFEGNFIQIVSISFRSVQFRRPRIWSVTDHESTVSVNFKLQPQSIVERLLRSRSPFVRATGPQCNFPFLLVVLYIRSRNSNPFRG